MGHRRIGSPTHCVTDFVGKKNLEIFCTFRPDHWVTGALGHRHIGSPTHWVTGALGHRRIGSPTHWVTGALSHRRIGSPARCVTDCRSCRDKKLVIFFHRHFFFLLSYSANCLFLHVVCLSVCTFVCHCLSVSFCLHVCLSVFLSVYLTVY